MRNIAAVCVLLILCMPGFVNASLQEPIVYAQCERTTATLTVGGNITLDGVNYNYAERVIGNMDIYDTLPDVSNFLTGFSTPCNIVVRYPDNTEQTIYNCSATSTQADSCSALDPAVSPDGDLIAFSVFRGTQFNKSENTFSTVIDPNAVKEDIGWFTFPNKYLSTTGAHLVFYRVSTGELTELPFISGVYESGPNFINNNEIVFTSTEDDHTSTLVFRSSGSRLGTKIWKMDVDGKNRRIASHHANSQEQHPFVLKSGQVAYSSWQILGGLPFRHNNGSPGGYTTFDNLFQIYRQDPDGANLFPIYGQHSGDHTESYFGEDHNAAHFIGQTPDSRVWFADYYRGNNNGLGVLIGVMPEPDGREGKDPFAVVSHADWYVPNNVILGAQWVNDDGDMGPGNGDNWPPVMVGEGFEITHPNYSDPLVYTGRLGYPSAVTSNTSSTNLMLTWGKGPCSVVASSYAYTKLGLPIPPLTNGYSNLVAANAINSLNRDIPGCDTGIYVASQIPSIHPNDLVQVVDSPLWHEFAARSMAPYQAIYSQPEPTQIATVEETTTRPEWLKAEAFGFLGAASITDRETHPKDGITFDGEHQFNLQGTDTIDYTDDELCGIRILAAQPNRNINTYYEMINVWGERMINLGEFPVKNRNPDGTPIIDPSGYEDTSFLVRMPANTPYITQAIDCQGRTLNTDQTWQHLRPGQEKTCGGCHVHSRDSRIEFTQSFAATPGYQIHRIGEGTVQLLDGDTGTTFNTRTVAGYGQQYDFTRDIKPIFDQHCIACHGSTNPAAGLDLSNTNMSDHNVSGSTWHKLVRDTSDQFRRPQLTRYVRALNSRGSLLYWKAANQRTDNRTDAQDPTDIDFGADHPTTITSEELGTLSRWIDTGAGQGPQHLKDTLNPVLHVSADVVNDEITAFHVGTVDVGSGIDPASLVVCLNNGSCSNIAPAANPVGAVAVNLATPQSDTTAEYTFQVSDMDGNTTESVLTAGFLMGAGSNPPPPPPALAVTVCNDSSINEGEVYSCNVSVVGGTPPYSYVVDFGDGLSADTGSTLSNSFNIQRGVVDGDSTQNISVSVTDSSSATSSDSLVLTVLNVAPSGNIVGSGAALIGESYSISVTTTDPGDDTVTAYSVDWKDGVIDGQLDHTFLTSGTYNIDVSVIDEDGTFLIGSHEVVISEPDPTQCVLSFEPVNKMSVRLITNCEIVP